MKDAELNPAQYASWFAALKQQILSAQQRAAIAVNRELANLYWRIGDSILRMQREEGWGTKVIQRVADDLKREFPAMKGFARSNLMYMRAIADSWTEAEIVQAPLGQLTWYHLITLQTKEVPIFQKKAKKVAQTACRSSYTLCKPRAKQGDGTFQQATKTTSTHLQSILRKS